MNRHNQRGQSLALTVIFLLVLCGVASFALDYGFFIASAQKFQTALDASALAGARALYDLTAAETKVRTSAVEEAYANTVIGTDHAVNPGNGVIVNPNTNVTLGTWDFTAHSFTPSDFDHATAVRVATNLGASVGFLHYIFGATLGLDKINPVRSSTAALASLPRRFPTFPMVVDKTYFVGILNANGPPLTLLTSGTTQAAWTGFFSGHNASTIQSYLATKQGNRYTCPGLTDPPISVGNSVDCTNGVTNNTFSIAATCYPPGSIVVIPIVGDPIVNGLNTVLGFSKFKIEYYSNLTGNSPSLTGEAIPWEDNANGELSATCFGLDCHAVLVE